MTHYTETEITLFNRYTNLLRDLVVKEMGSFDGITLNATKCCNCARECPAGIPRQLRDTDRVCCPACVRHRSLVSALTREVHGEEGSASITKNTPVAQLTAEVTKAIRNERAKRQTLVAPTDAARLKKLGDGINRLKQSLKDVTDADEYVARERVIAAAIAGYRKQSGGIDPPEVEARKPDEVLP